MIRLKMVNSMQAANWLKERDNFLILTHRRPDGDALGSAAGLCQGLREAGKTAYALRNPEATSTYEKYILDYYAPEDFVPEHIISVDTASENQFQINGKEYLEKVELSIDHHLSNTGYAATTCMDSERSSCGEMVFDILIEIAGNVSDTTATALYVALADDTGCFCYGNTNAQCLKTAAILVEAGAPNALINKELFRTKSKKRLAIEAEFTKNIEYYMNDTVGIATLTQELRNRFEVANEDVEDLASIPGQVEGVIVAITLREQKDGATKVSVRTTMEASANDICQCFGGGGHAMAAGCTINASPEEAKSQILKAIEEVWVR